MRMAANGCLHACLVQVDAHVFIPKDYWCVQHGCMGAAWEQRHVGQAHRHWWSERSCELESMGIRVKPYGLGQVHSALSAPATATHTGQS